MCSSEQSNYLLNVLRMKAGDRMLVFNGADGEWRAQIAGAGKRGAVLQIVDQVRAQIGGPDIDYVFAPLKRSRLDYMVQKAVEMGVARLRPVLTRRTIAERVNLERMRANAIEAAEQCGVLRIPLVAEPQKLSTLLADWDANRRLIFCDEDAARASPLDVLQKELRTTEGGSPVAKKAPPLAVLVGPEGGFAPDERELLRSKHYAVPISLGPRIMRADTAAVAALALVNAVAGDWR